MLFIVSICVVLWISLEIIKALRNLYWHPLSKFPGPKLWIAFPLFRFWAAWRGRLAWDMRRFHEQYGEVVRYSASELSFTTAQAWKDIYGHGHKQLPKQTPPAAVGHIISSTDADHSRYRKALSHGFSDQSLRLQEPLIKSHVDLLMQCLKNEAMSGRPVDLTKYYNLCTFDIISDLAFGQSFGCLQRGDYNEYILKIFEFVEATPGVFGASRENMPLIWSLTGEKLFDWWVRHRRAPLQKLTYNAAMSRMHNPTMTDRGDLMTTMLRHRGEKDGLSDAEIGANANILFIAGSETTATLLAGVSYWLLRTPHALRIIRDEVRSAFDREEDITFSSAPQKLPYLLACLNEAFRMYPPVGSIISRVTQEPTMVSGYLVPPGTNVGVPQLSTNHSPANFHRSHEFIPERWLAAATEDPSSPFYNDKRDVMQPFSVGPRNCIGRNLAYHEMRVILARFIWKFDAVLVPEEGGGGDHEKYLRKGDDVDDNDILTLPRWEDQKIYILWSKPPLWANLRIAPHEHETTGQLAS